MRRDRVASIEKSLEKSYALIDEVKDKMLYKNREQAYRALRAVLHGVRDRLTVAEAADFAGELPTLLKGLYYEGWTPTGKPLRERRRADFLGRVASELGNNPATPIEETCRQTFAVLARHISPGEIDDVLHCLPEKVRGIFH